MERAEVQSRSVWVGIIKGGWHVHTMFGGLAVGGWWGMKRGGVLSGQAAHRGCWDSARVNREGGGMKQVSLGGHSVAAARLRSTTLH